MLKIALSLCAGLVFAAACGAPDSPEPSGGGSIVELVIAHTNDIHGQTGPMDAFWIDEQAPPQVGGLAHVASILEDWRAASADRGGGFLYLDAGDIWQGTPEGKSSHSSIRWQS